MSTIVRVGKKLKKYLMPKAKPCVSYVRRIERVKTAERVVAMTFDDGPMNAPCSPASFDGIDYGDTPLTSVILDTLDKYGAKGTFDVIGYTGDNYPDECGAVGSPSWGGVRYDHYPDYKKDALAGAENQGEFLGRMIDGGHQVTNHGYKHIIFGKKPFVYGKRVYMKNIDEVTEDLLRLDGILKDRYDYKITMSRPPHYVDKISGGFTSYDAYALLGYQYMAASYDGAGWLPGAGESTEESFSAEVAEMVSPIKKILSEDPDFFCGQIIFQKDGYNMAKRTPVAFGLAKQLDLLTSAGYKVVTVNELLGYSQFADVGRDDPDYDIFDSLIAHHAIAYSDNTLCPERHMSVGELAMLVAPRKWAVEKRAEEIKKKGARLSNYYGALEWCRREGLLGAKIKEDAPLTSEIFSPFSRYFEKTPNNFTRREVLKNYKQREKIMILTEPTMEYDRQIQAYRQEFLTFGGSMDGCGSLRNCDRTQDWINELESWKKPETTPPHLVPCTQYIYVRESDGKIVGMIQIRHYFNEYLEKYGGHIGYSVCHSERRKGYATQMLKKILPECKALGIDKVLITCLTDNEGSRKVIIKNGGVYESTVYEPEEKVYLERYWINTEISGQKKTL